MSTQKRKSPKPKGKHKGKTKPVDLYSNSLLELPLIRELLKDIVARGGLHDFSLSDLLEDKEEKYGNPKTKLGQAITNKVNYCKRYPSHYETLQLSCFGHIIDNSQLPKRVRVDSPSTVEKSLPYSPPITAISRKLLSPIMPTKDIANTFSSMSLNSFGLTAPPHEEVEVDLENGYTNGNLMIFAAEKTLCGTTKKKALTTTVTFVLSSIDPRWMSKTKPQGFFPFQMTQTSNNAVVFGGPISHYDFFYGPRMNDQNTFDAEDWEHAFFIS